MHLARGLLAEPALQQKLNAWWLEAVEKMALRHGHQISGLITDVVKSWDAAEVSGKVGLEIGGICSSFASTGRWSVALWASRCSLSLT